jgi:archaellum biogenesis ATPase FlaH
MQNYNPATEQQPMTALHDATTLTIRLDSATYKIALKELLEKTKARLSVDSGKQPAITFEIAPGVTIAIDSIYGSPGNMGSARFWLILQQ